jgi:NAD(P)-dependent dehydrogenase (short-subunit alcohol dehydrogenase family)
MSGAHAQAAEALAAEITAAGGRAIAIGADLRSPDAPGELVQATADALGAVDVLVSNAGLSRVQPSEDITAAQFDEMLAVNLPDQPGHLPRRRHPPPVDIGRRPPGLAERAVSDRHEQHLACQGGRGGEGIEE